jgi:hypothetical protein
MAELPGKPFLRKVATEELEQIPQRAALEDQSAVHIQFAEIEVRMQRKLPRGQRARETYGHIRPRLCGLNPAEL